MDNQHKMIKGYRDLSQEEIDAMNLVKGRAQNVSETVTYVERMVDKMPEDTEAEIAEKAEAARWLNEGKMELQKGFMAVTRAIARPTSF